MTSTAPTETAMRTPLPLLPLLLAALLPLSACSPESAPPAAPASSTPSADAPVLALACGCALPDVGHCAEYVQLDGRYVELVPPHDLGHMPFCGKTGLRAKVEGELDGDRFVARTFAYVD